LGLPDDWDIPASWLEGEFISEPDSNFKTEPSNQKMKNPEVKILGDYSKAPPEEFWNSFLHSPIPEEVSTGINVDRLEYHLANKSAMLTEQQKLRGERIIYSLRNGASSLQKVRLPPVMVPNANSTVRAGPAVTDTVATWIKCGFAVGPFSEPPLKNFRVNSLVAIDNGVKVRPIFFGCVTATGVLF
jgi:hypothetical protein